MTAALDNFLLGRVGSNRCPLSDCVEVGLDFEEPVEYERTGDIHCFAHREEAHEVVADAQVVAIRGNV
jgi:hypothetical protein